MRTFHYDGRGFLTREVQPESGATTYLYDAQGNVIKKETPTGTLFSSFDEAGRILAVSSPQAILKQFSYGAMGAASGKLIEAQSFNWRTAAPVCTLFEVRQGDGNLTGRIIQLHPGGGHHGPEAYWKVSSPKGGTVRIGPQF